MALRVVVWVQGDLFLVDASGSRAMSQSAPQPASTPEELATELRSLLSRGRRGSSKNVLFVTDSQLLLPALEEVPPADAKLAAKLLAKRVEKAKLINEPFSLGIQPIVQPGDKPPPRRYLVTVGGLAWLKQLDAIATETGHMLVGVLPLAVGLRPQLKKASSPAGQPFLMVLGIEKALYQVVGRSDGTILFYRSLSMAGGAAVDGLQREVRRTLLFAEQKLNIKIPLILLSEELGSMEAGMELGGGCSGGDVRAGLNRSGGGSFVGTLFARVCRECSAKGDCSTRAYEAVANGFESGIGGNDRLYGGVGGYEVGGALFAFGAMSSRGGLTQSGPGKSGAFAKRVTGVFSGFRWGASGGGGDVGACGGVDSS